MNDEVTITPRVNGAPVTRTLPTRTTLASFVRDSLGLTGTKLSCELQVCGVCTVLVDGDPVSACTYLAVDADDRDVVTIEGLSGERGGLHPLQQAFIDRFASQCGFCTPGFILMAKSLLDRQPDASEEEITEWLDGNICRCTGYRPILEAVTQAAAQLRGQGVAAHDDE
jgi:aerobic-type carbon monoxide dehydrogenase small subunit (CoxS/CutS family)